MGGLAVLLCASIGGGFALREASEPDAPVFCTLGLPIRQLDGRTVAIQDANRRDDHCDGDQTTPGIDTLGTDCKVRAPDGTVLSVEKSTRADGTCGRNSPAP